MGIIFAKFHQDSQVTMVDNNLEAVTLAKENTSLNQTKNTEVIKVDVARDNLDKKFDMALTNPPWTKNISVIPKLVQFALDHLKINGRFYLVINKTFRTEDIIESIFENVEVVAMKEPYKILMAVKKIAKIDPLREKVLGQLRSLKITPDILKDQNFLTSTHYLNLIIKTAKIQKTETILEIGPGSGQLTTLLAEHAKKVVTLEIDGKFKPVLQKLPNNVEIIYGNALNIVGRHMANIKFDKFVSCIPYSLCQPLTHKLAHAKTCPIYIVLPEQFVNLLQDHHIFSAVFDIKILFKIPRAYFYPIPKTDSFLVYLHKNNDKLSKENLSRWTRKFIYGNEGKTLKNILRLAVEKINEQLLGEKLTKNQARKIVDEFKIEDSLLERDQYSGEVYQQSANAVEKYFS
jgi:16S rRNA A1518/A1519 N6-dimethyltransferase RsmA/KsgA/DIM1 with predicted DNA glycosylase/AP lyase activity